MKRRTSHALATCALLSSFAWPGLADPTAADKAVATRLYEDAEKLTASGNLANACPKYAESQQRDPQLGTLLHLADCYEKMGKTASAWASFKEAAELAARKSASAKEAREQTARTRAQALESKLSNLVIMVTSGDVPGFELKQNGIPLGRGVWGSPVPVDPGSYTLTAQATGKKAWAKTVDVGASATRVEVLVPPLEDDVAPAAAAAPPPPIMSQPQQLPPMTGNPSPPFNGAAMAGADASSTGSGQRTIGWVVGGAGVVGVGLGAAFGLMSQSKTSDRDRICSTSQCPRASLSQYFDAEDSAKTDATISNVAFIVGGAAVLGGVVLLLTAPSGRPVGTAFRVTPWGSSNSAGAMMGGTW